MITYIAARNAPMRTAPIVLFSVTAAGLIAATVVTVTKKGDGDG